MLSKRELEITIDNRNGTLWNITQLVPDFTWKTVRIGKAGTLDMTVIRNPTWQSNQYEIKCGNIIRIKLDGDFFCYGVIFSVEETDERTIRILAYDQIRYLMETDTYIRTNVKASQVIKDNALELGLNVGHITDTLHVIPKFGQINQKRMDMIYTALDQTLLAKGTTFVFYDDAGALTLRNITEMKINLMLGDGSLVYGYSLSSNIDSDTYNRVKLVQEDDKGGIQHAYIYERSDTIKRWGRLQYHQKVDNGLNRAQIDAMANRFLEFKNREQRKFTIEALGYPAVRAGTVIQVTIKEIDINQNYLVEECTHSFKGDEHTMTLTLKEYDYLD